MGKTSQPKLRKVSVRNIGLELTTDCGARVLGGRPLMVANYVSPIWCPQQTVGDTKRGMGASNELNPKVAQCGSVNN